MPPQPLPSIVAAIEAVMMMVVTISISGNDDDPRLIIIITKSTVLIVVMMMVMVVIKKLHLLNVFVGGRDRTGHIDDLKQGRRVRNRLQQVRKRIGIQNLRRSGACN